MCSLRDKIRGCMIGGAIGDALGYPVEFMTMSQIIKKYGSDGICDFKINSDSKKALISDDTQMTLFTAYGLIWARSRKKTLWWDYIKEIYLAYIRWLYTQDGVMRKPGWIRKQPFERDFDLKIMDIPELYSKRAPGNTCISALSSGEFGKFWVPINNSKGCGGVMRVSPIGLALHNEPEYACDVAIDAAAITHGHPTGFNAAGAFAYIISQLVNGISLIEAIEKCILHMGKYPYNNIKETIDRLRTVQKLEKTGLSTQDILTQMGEGWVADEALGLALCFALKGKDNPVEALKMSVNHSGDSDSVGAICGNLLGAMYGIEAFPQAWIEQVELSEFILNIADRLHEAAK